MTTQEKIFFAQKTKPISIEDLRSSVRELQPHHEIENLFIKDMRLEFSQLNEKEYQRIVNESGTFYFYNDFAK